MKERFEDPQTARWARQGYIDFWAAMIVWRIVHKNDTRPVHFPSQEIAKAVEIKVNRSLKALFG